MPDECEGQQAQGESGGSALPTGVTATTSVAVAPEQWTALHKWMQTRIWGPASPLTGARQFRRYIDKLRQVHLPLAAPHMQR